MFSSDESEKLPETDAAAGPQGPPAKPPAKKGMARLIAATRYSAAGMRAALRSEEAVRMEVAAFIVMAPLGFWLGSTAVEKVLLVGSLVLVILMELINTAIEKVIDRFSSEYHELSRVAKDIGSATVLISIAFVLFTWAVILYPS
ncbi:MAG: diacylglycerol kinase [Pseudohongiellaceae bacterium]|jgi:diacylglycerol kinase (ATP)